MFTLLLISVCHVNSTGFYLDYAKHFWVISKLSVPIQRINYQAADRESCQTIATSEAKLCTKLTLTMKFYSFYSTSQVVQGMQSSTCAILAGCKRCEPFLLCCIIFIQNFMFCIECCACPRTISTSYEMCTNCRNHVLLYTVITVYTCMTNWPRGRLNGDTELEF